MFTGRCGPTGWFFQAAQEMTSDGYALVIPKAMPEGCQLSKIFSDIWYYGHWL